MLTVDKHGRPRLWKTENLCTVAQKRTNLEMGTSLNLVMAVYAQEEGSSIMKNKDLIHKKYFFEVFLQKFTN